MKPTIIPHPLKRIHFNYNSEAALSYFEQAFIDRYKQLHDELATIKNELFVLVPDIKRIISELNQVTIILENLRTIVNRIERVFGLALAEETSPGAHTIKVGEIQNALDEFQAIRSEYWEKMVPMYKQFNSVFEKFTTFDDTVEQFEKEYSDPLFNNPETMEIDARCFDKDMNEFRVEWMAVAHLQDECLDQYSDWAKKQTTLVGEADGLYERIKKLFRHISSIQNFDSGNAKKEFGLN